MVACPGKVMYVTHDHILSLYASSIEATVRIYYHGKYSLRCSLMVLQMGLNIEEYGRGRCYLSTLASSKT